MSKSIQLKNKDNENIYPYGIIKEFILYDNINGSNKDITLNDSVENYKYIEIFFKWENSMYKSVKLYNANNNSALLDMLDFSNRIIFATKTITISNKSIKVARYKHYTIADNESWIPYGSSANVIYITRVVGYK